MNVSIIVPVYNVKEYLIKCLDSLSAQTLNNYEVIVVDDGSTDGSGEMAEKYCQNDQRFHCIHKENGGLMSAWMYGLEHANGDYVGFVDSDDYVDETMYDEMYQKVLEYKADVVLCNHVYVMLDNSNELVLHRNPLKEGAYEGERLEELRYSIFPRINSDYISPSRWSKLIKRELLLQNVKYFDQRITSAEDVNSMIPCLLAMKKLYYIDKPFYHYVQRRTSISNVFNEEILQTYIVLIEKIKQAMFDYKLQDTIGIETDLWNYYGYLWSLYVVKSKLKIRDKNFQMNRLAYIPEFVSASNGVGTGIGEKLYKYSIQHKRGWIFILVQMIKLSLK